MASIADYVCTFDYFIASYCIKPLAPFERVCVIMC